MLKALKYNLKALFSIYIYIQKKKQPKYDFYELTKIIKMKYS